VPAQASGILEGKQVMSHAIVVGPHPINGERVKAGDVSPQDYMPFSARQKVADEINRHWAEFVTEMHDGSTSGREVAEKFWKFVTR
jgi:hypothetical protein